MSTVCKLEPNVRLDRTLRKQQRRQMQEDIRKAPTATKRAVLALVLKHVTEIMLDPRRTGAKKEEILARLGEPK